MSGDRTEGGERDSGRRRWIVREPLAAGVRSAPRRGNVVITIACISDRCDERLRFQTTDGDGALRATCAGCGGTFRLGGGVVASVSDTG